MDLFDNLPEATLDEPKEPPIPNRAFLHCDFDQWEPDLMPDLSMIDK